MTPAAATAVVPAAATALPDSPDAGTKTDALPAASTCAKSALLLHLYGIFWDLETWFLNFFVNNRTYTFKELLWPFFGQTLKFF